VHNAPGFLLYQNNKVM